MVESDGQSSENDPLLHLGLELASVLRLAFQSDALPTELFPAPRLTSVADKLVVESDGQSSEHDEADRYLAGGRRALRACWCGAGCRTSPSHVAFRQ